MAGTGKGILRVAIEDFFNTTPVGKWFTDWFVQFGEWLEDAIFGHYRDILDKYNATPGLPNSLKMIGKGTPDSPRQGGIGMAAGMVFGLGQAAAGNLLTPILQKTQYFTNREYTPARFSPDVAATVLRKNPGETKRMIDHMLDQGWSEEDVQNWLLLTIPEFSPDQLIKYWFRGLLADSEIDARLKQLGFIDMDIAKLKEGSKLIPGVSDLINLAVRDAWNDQAANLFGYDEDYPSQVGEWTAKQGMPSEWAKRYWRAHWNLPSPSQAYEMFQRLRPGRSSVPFTKSDLETLLRIADYPKYFRERLVEISYSPFTRVDVRRMYKVGILTYEDVIEAYKDIGYNDEKAKQLADFTIKYENSDGSDKLSQYDDLSISLVQQAFIKGLIDEAALRLYLQDKKYEDSEINVVVELNKLKMKVDSYPDMLNTFRTEMRGIIEKAYTARAITEDDAKKSLSDVGFRDQDIGYILKAAELNYQIGTKNDKINMIGDMYTNHSIDRSTAYSMLGTLNLSGTEQEQIFLEWDNQRKMRNKRLTLSQYKSAYEYKFITRDEFIDNLEGLGYSDSDITLLMKIEDASAAKAQESEG